MKETMISLSLLLVWGAATAQESHPDSTDVFYKHLELEETVVTGLAGDTKMKEMPAPVSGFQFPACIGSSRPVRESDRQLHLCRPERRPVRGRITRVYIPKRFGAPAWR